MDREILKYVDHTLLSQTATWEAIKEVLDDAVKYGAASACIPAAYVKQAAEYVGEKLPVCTVIGFPNGYSTKEAKVFEAKDAIEKGASEIDMVVNIGFLKDRRYGEVEDEIRAVKEACGERILKVIIETCLLTEEEKIKMCETVSQSGAEYIKTSTGFAASGATVEDVRLFRANISPDTRIKAAGGIRTFEQAQAMIEAGADRLGASALIALAR